MTASPKPKSPSLLTGRKTLGSIPQCAVERDSSEGVVVHFRLSQQDWSRYETRIGRQDPAEYIWSNVIKPATQGHIY